MLICDNEFFFVQLENEAAFFLRNKINLSDWGSLLTRSSHAITTLS